MQLTVRVMSTKNKVTREREKKLPVIYRAVCLRGLCISPPPPLSSPSLRKDNKRITPVAISFHKRMLAETFKLKLYVKSSKKDQIK